MSIDLWRIRFRDNFAAHSRLVWASSWESAEALGQEWASLRGHRFIGADLETVAREGVALEVPTVTAPPAKPIAEDKLPSAAVYANALPSKPSK